MSAAPNYLTSFRPFTGFEGFENVQSNAFTNALGQIPAANAAMATVLAREGLAASSNLESVKLQLKQNQNQYDATSKRNKWAAALSLASAFGGGGSGGTKATVQLPQGTGMFDYFGNMFSLNGMVGQTMSNGSARTRATNENAAKIVGTS
jgi:hypothetical protein